MGFFSRIFQPDPVVAYGKELLEFPTEGLASLVDSMSVEEIYASQPMLRIVVDFIARNTAHLGLKTFTRIGEDRHRVRDGNLPQIIANPNPFLTRYELFYRLTLDRKLYDIAYWWVHLDPARETAGGWRIDPIPPTWVTKHIGLSPFGVEAIEFAPMGARRPIRIDAPELIVFPGHLPGSARGHISPVETLKSLLAEQTYAAKYREQIWKRGGRASAVIERPAGVAWSDETARRFREDFRRLWTGNGANAGGVPVLEDGMKITRLGFSAREEEFVEVAKLSLQTVAAIYGVNPVMVGLLDHANYSNVREFRRMLYGDTLGPDLASIEERLNNFLLPLVDPDRDLFVEFNIEEKLQGAFEEQANVLSSSVGRPWMTADEARRLQNLPALGGDAAKLVTPLNVLVGGLASPRDTAPNKTHGQAKTGRPYRAKSPDHIGDDDRAAFEEVFARFYKRQARTVLSRLGAKAGGEWWDGDRWDRELAEDLLPVQQAVADRIGREQMRHLGYEPGDYDVDVTRAWLEAVGRSKAQAVNRATFRQLAETLDNGDDPAGVFDLAQSSRVQTASSTLCACMAGFALTEAARQSGRAGATKTWLVQSANPRSAHAVMDGETVPLGEVFSNGLKWPGDPAGDVDQVAGCQCGIEVVIP